MDDNARQERDSLEKGEASRLSLRTLASVKLMYSSSVQCTAHPITHPVLVDRALAFAGSSQTTPSWVLDNTRRRLQRSQPTLVAV